MKLTSLKQFCIALACATILGISAADARIVKGLGTHAKELKGQPVKAKSVQDQAAAEDTTALLTPRPAFMLVGDSITQWSSQVDTKGWGARLQDTYVRSVDVINRGLSGYNTTNFINLVLPGVSDEIAYQFKPVLITLWLGTNDAAIVGGPNDHQHVPVDEYAHNLVVIATKFLALAPQAKILVITPGVVDDVARLKAAGGGPVDRSNAQSKLYAEACVKAVKDLPGVAVLDLYTTLMTKYPDPAKRAALLRDGLHLSTQGNGVVYDLVSQQVTALLPSTMLQTPQFPYF